MCVERVMGQSGVRIKKSDILVKRMCLEGNTSKMVCSFSTTFSFSPIAPFALSPKMGHSISRNMDRKK